MFIIFGTRGRLTNASPSDVLPNSCPTCRHDLVLKDNKVWFTLFFLPIFPISNKGSFYHCKQCDGAYKAQAREQLLRTTG